MATSGILATSFASRLGASRRSIDSLGSQLPPLVSGADELRIDVTPLLLHGRLVMDRVAFDVITSSRYGKAQTLARQLADFYEAGLVVLQDFKDFGSNRVRILDEARVAALQYERSFWLAELRRTIEWWEGHRANYSNAYGKQLVSEATIPWSILAVLESEDAPLQARNIERVRDAIYNDATDEDRRFTDIAVGSLLDYANCNRLNAQRFDAPVYDWDDMHGFMTASDRVALAYGGRNQAARYVVTEIAKIDLGDLRTSEVIAMLSDRRIAAFRTYVDESFHRGPAHMEAEKDRLYAALLDHRVRLMDRERFKFLMRLANAALLGNFGLIGDALKATPLPDLVIKTTDDFIKSMITDAEGASPAPSPDAALKAIYAIKRHVRR